MSGVAVNTQEHAVTVRASQPVAERRTDLINSLDDAARIAEYVAKSKLFACSNPAEALVKILAGREMGFEPIISMTSIHVIEGKPAPGAELIAAAIRRRGSGYDLDTDEINDDAVQLTFWRLLADGTRKKLGTLRYTMEDAKRKGWHVTSSGKVKPQWVQKGANMLFARAVTDGKRFYCPDVLTNVCDADEMEGITVSNSAVSAPQVVANQQRPQAISPRVPTRVSSASDPFDPANDPEVATALVVNDDGSLSSPLDVLQGYYNRIEASLVELGFTRAQLQQKITRQYGMTSLREIQDTAILASIERDLDSVRLRRRNTTTTAEHVAKTTQVAAPEQPIPVPVELDGQSGAAQLATV